jgi:hypothetical protein
MLGVNVTYAETGEVIDVTARTLQVAITDTLDSVSKVSARMKGLAEQHAFSALDISYNGVAQFSGIVQIQNDTFRGASTLNKFSTWRAADNTLRLEKRIANFIYTNTLVEDIIADLLTRYPSGITYNNVEATNVNVESIPFLYMPLINCIKQLADIAGCRWYIDADNDLHFFTVNEGAGAVVFSTTTDGGLARNILSESIGVDHEIDASTANRVWVIGARTPSPTLREQTFTAAGERIFKLGFTPRNYTVYEDGVAVDAANVRVDTPENEADVTTKYLVNTRNQVLRIPSGKDALVTNGVDELKITYNPEIQIADYFEDSSSVAKYGVYEKAIKDRSIIDKSTARQRGRAELRRNNSAKTTISLETRELNVRRGLVYRVVIPEANIDASFLCVGIQTIIQAPDTVNITKTVTLEEVT